MTPEPDKGGTQIVPTPQAGIDALMIFVPGLFTAHNIMFSESRVFSE